MRVARRAPVLASLLLAIGAVMPIGSAARPATSSATASASGTGVAAAPLTAGFGQASGSHLTRDGEPFWFRGAAIYGTSNPGVRSVITAAAAAIPWAGIERVSVDSDELEGAAPGQSYGGSVSADGRFVAYMSSAPLVPDDANSWTDIYVRDRQAGTTERVSVAVGGGDPNHESYFPSISADGRYVAFESGATNLITGDTNGFKDIFVFDRTMGTTERVNVASGGAAADNESNEPKLSDDGRFVAFYSRGTTLVADDTNGRLDVFVRDRTTHTTELVSRNSSGQIGASDSFSPTISGDGRFVAFTSRNLTAQSVFTDNVYVRDRTAGTSELISRSAAGSPANGLSGAADISADGRFVVFQTEGTTLEAGDTNGAVDIFLRDRTANLTERISVAGGGGFGTGNSFSPSVRDDGRVVVFQSVAPDLVVGDANGGSDVFARDRTVGTTERISVTATGVEGAGFSGVPAISADGRAVVFRSRAANLVVGDTNGELDVLVRSADLASPTAPIGVSAVGGVESATLAWSAPSDDGGSNVIEYTITASPGGATTTVAGNQSSAIVSGLTVGTAYTFTVTATNAIGTSPASAPSNEVTPTAPTSPDAPTGVTAAAGDGQASVSWVAPSSDGGRPITTYTVTAAPGGASLVAAADATSATIGGLANGTAYTFTVTATNAIGMSPASDPSAPATPQSGAPPPQTASETVPPEGGSASTDPGGVGPTTTDPITTSIGVPPTAGGGSVTIAETAITAAPPTGYQFLGQQVDITSTAATSASNPLTIVFTIDQSVLLAATGMAAPPPESVDITRAEGAGAPAVILTCIVAVPPIDPDPCVSDRQYDGNGDLRVTILTGTASHWNSAIRPTAVTVSNSGYAPKAVTVAQGGIVLWTFTGTKPHSVTDSLKLGPGRTPLFSSGPITSGRFGSAFRAAGTYSYASTVKGDPGSFTGSVAVPIRISPASGTVATSFTVTWSSATISGFVFDVQYRFMKAAANRWSRQTTWQSGVTTTSASFSPTLGAGTYAFSARLRNPTTGVATGWSPELIVVATP